MTMPPRKVCLRILHLHDVVMSSDSSHEAETARQKLRKLLAEYGCKYSDILEIRAALAEDIADDASNPSDDDEAVEAEAAAMQARGINILDLLVALLGRYVWIRSPHERVAVALCVLNAWVFDRFEHCPRLVVLAPASSHGKSRLLKKFVRLLLPQNFYSGNASAASIYGHLEYYPGCPLVIDEADNLKIEGALLALFDEGHEYDGTITRFNKTYDVFGPLFLGGIGTALPAPLMRRAVVIHMEMRPADIALQPLNLSDPPRELQIAKALINEFVATCSLSTQPEMPTEIHNDRHTDNWRPLISIADALGRGELARDAAIALTPQRGEESLLVKLATALLQVFDNPHPSSPYGANRTACDDMLAALVRLEDDYWVEWRGRDGKREPRQLTHSELAKIIWPLGPRKDAKCRRGYERAQFEEIWRTYCPSRGDKKSTGSIRLLSTDRRAAAG
jgi:hypothetical protein